MLGELSASSFIAMVGTTRGPSRRSQKAPFRRLLLLRLVEALLQDAGGGELHRLTSRYLDRGARAGIPALRYWLGGMRPFSASVEARFCASLIRWVSMPS